MNTLTRYLKTNLPQTLSHNSTCQGCSEDTGLNGYISLLILLGVIDFAWTNLRFLVSIFFLMTYIAGILLQRKKVNTDNILSSGFL